MTFRYFNCQEYWKIQRKRVVFVVSILYNFSSWHILNNIASSETENVWVLEYYVRWVLWNCYTNCQLQCQNLPAVVSPKICAYSTFKLYLKQHYEQKILFTNLASLSIYVCSLEIVKWYSSLIMPIRNLLRKWKRKAPPKAAFSSIFTNNYHYILMNIYIDIHRTHRCYHNIRYQLV